MRRPTSGRPARASLALAAVLSCATPAAAADDPLRVLFLGNSYTGVNDLPALVADLCASAGVAVVVDAHTPGGSTLGAPQANGAPHVSNPTSQAKLAVGGWDVVVLQEQSYLPTIPQALAAYSEPAVVQLDAVVDATSPGARTLLFMTWGRASGGGPFCLGSWCSPAFADFDAMQASLESAYEGLAALAGADVCPVGLAWQSYLHGPAPVALHKADGSHPTLAGSYLAACCFYVALTDASPVGLSFTAGLDPALALELQTVARDAVLGHGCGAAVTVPGPFALELASGGAVGELARFVVDGPWTGAPLAAFALAALPAEVALPEGTLGLDLSALVLGPVLSSSSVPGVGVPFGVAVPGDPSLVGVTVHAQGAALVGGSAVLTDALRWRLCP